MDEGFDIQTIYETFDIGWKKFVMFVHGEVHRVGLSPDIAQFIRDNVAKESMFALVTLQTFIRSVPEDSSKDSEAEAKRRVILEAIEAKDMDTLATFLPVGFGLDPTKIPADIVERGFRFAEFFVTCVRDVERK